MKKFYLIISIFLSVSGLRAQEICSDLFISEYVEGSSFNKVIEIYNPTSGTIELDGAYEIQSFYNGSDTPGFKFKLSGVISSQDVYVISHPSADPDVLALTDTTNIVCNWNGNDAIILINLITQDTIDVVGLVGYDPGLAWEVDTGSTHDHTLVRLSDIQQGTWDWYEGEFEWFAYGVDDFSHLGWHVMDPCIANPSLFFNPVAISVSEDIGTFEVEVGIINPNFNTTEVQANESGGTATSGIDHIFYVQTLSFPPFSSAPEPVEITVVDDAEVEPNETIELSLSNATNQATLVSGTLIITIIDNDALGMNSVNEKSAKVYPSLNSGIFSVETDVPYSLSVFDVLGNEVWKQDVFKNISLSLPQHGMYFLKFENESGTVVRRVVVQ